jgi:hypothetical protein
MLMIINYIKLNYNKIKIYEYIILGALILYILNLYYIKKNILLDINSFLNKIYLKNRKNFKLYLQLIVLILFVLILVIYNYSYITAYCMLIFLIVSLNNNLQYIELFRNYEKLVITEMNEIIKKNKNNKKINSSNIETFGISDQNKNNILTILKEQIKYDKSNIVLDNDQLLNFINEFNAGKNQYYYNNEIIDLYNKHNENSKKYNTTQGLQIL